MKNIVAPMMGLMAALASFESLAAKTVLSQQNLADFAAHTEFRFGVLSNYTAEGDGLKAHLMLANHSTVALPAGVSSWRIYFHSVRAIAAADTAGLHLTHIQGDLNELAPTADFAGLPAGASLDFPFRSSDWMVSYTDFMPRAFIAQAGMKPVIFANTDTEQLTDFVEPISTSAQQLRYGNTKKDLYPIATAASRYQDNLAVNQAKVSATDVALRIIPKPGALKASGGSADLDNNWQIRYAGRLAQEAMYLQAQLSAQGLTIALQPDNVPAQGKVIWLQAEARDALKNQPADNPRKESESKENQSKESQSKESYELSITANKILINGSDNAGVFYGVQSLLQLIPVERAARYPLPQLTIADSPRFRWRGMHYDMARNFHGKAVTLRLIDNMARYKLNRLHLHLTDDEGWRLEIPGLPELTDIGAKRCFDLSEQSCLLTQLGTGPNTSGSGNGFYTTADFVEILKYAAARHIEVIPEIDMPGHARAAVKSMQVRYTTLMAAGQKVEAERYLLSDAADTSHYNTVQNYNDDAVNVCLPSTYAFVDKIIYELQQLYRLAGTRLTTFHMGGDEVGKGAWEHSPACATLFAKGDAGVAGVADLKPYFVSRIADITHHRGLALAGWEDGLMYDPANTFKRSQFGNEQVIANAWDNIWEWGVADRAYRLANAGYAVVLSPGTHLYFDHPYEANPEERGYYWATRYSDTAKVFGFMPDNYYANAERTNAGQPIANLEALVGRELPPLRKPENILGMQGQLWSETVRTPEQLEQMIYPRLLALAERAWSKADWEGNSPDPAARQRDWTLFAHRLVDRELPKLAQNGTGFYLPPPGAILGNGKLFANSGFPGLGIEYSLDKGASWQIFSGSVVVDKSTIQLRSVLGNVRSRATNVQ